MRIVQVLVTLSYGDGVGNDTLAINRILKEEGYDTHIYAENIDPRIDQTLVTRIHKMKPLSEHDVVIYHLSTGCNLNLDIQEWKCRIIYRYHNVTPPNFFQLYNQNAYNLCSEGVSQAREMGKDASYVLADSEFNKRDLLGMGYTCEIDVLPILIPFEDYQKPINQKVIEKYRDGWTNIIFTGRMAPNKKQEDVIKIFSYYKKYKNPRSRLILVGSYDKGDSYYQRVLKYTQCLGVEDVIFTGHIKFDEILAYYQLADVFLCMSEHEGFCIPLVEAMYFQTPIIAYESTAIPYTMNHQGAIVDTKEPSYVASIMDRIVKDEKVKAKLIEDQNNVLTAYRYETIRTQFVKLLDSYIRGEK